MESNFDGSHFCYSSYSHTLVFKLGSSKIASLQVFDEGIVVRNSYLLSLSDIKELSDFIIWFIENKTTHKLYLSHRQIERRIRLNNLLHFLHINREDTEDFILPYSSNERQVQQKTA